jgi:hypothetical protein
MATEAQKDVRRQPVSPSFPQTYGIGNEESKAMF